MKNKELWKEYVRFSTVDQRYLMFKVWEKTYDIKKACSDSQLSRGTFYYWKPRFKKYGYRGLQGRYDQFAQMTKVKIVHDSKMSKLVKKNPRFGLITTKKLQEIAKIKWKRQSKIIYTAQVIFVGKTGYGKSTTINTIIGDNIFETDPVFSCTKECQSAEFSIGDEKHYFSMIDFPGIGESRVLNKEYLRLYSKFLFPTNLIVYILRADQRDFVLDKKAFETIFINVKDKILIGLNCVDKIEPINKQHSFFLNPAQKQNIDKKIRQVSEEFKISPDRVIPYSAVELYNIDVLTQAIIERLL